MIRVHFFAKLFEKTSSCATLYEVNYFHNRIKHILQKTRKILHASIMQCNSLTLGDFSLTSIWKPDLHPSIARAPSVHFSLQTLHFKKLRDAVHYILSCGCSFQRIAIQKLFLNLLFMYLLNKYQELQA